MRSLLFGCLTWVVSSCVPGCLIPPPLEQELIPDNLPPRILPQNLEPGFSKIPISLIEQCPEQQSFGATVVEPDDDVFYYRVFVDYASPGSDQFPEPIEQATEPNRPVPIQFNVGKNAFVSESNPHTVELFVSDRPFRQGLIDPPGRVLNDPDGLTDTFIWTVILDPSQNALCPES